MDNITLNLSSQTDTIAGLRDKYKEKFDDFIKDHMNTLKTYKKAFIFSIIFFLISVAVMVTAKVCKNNTILNSTITEIIYVAVMFTCVITVMSTFKYADKTILSYNDLMIRLQYINQQFEQLCRSTSISDALTAWEAAISEISGLDWQCMSDLGTKLKSYNILYAIQDSGKILEYFSDYEDNTMKIVYTHKDGIIKNSVIYCDTIKRNTMIEKSTLTLENAELNVVIKYERTEQAKNTKVVTNVKVKAPDFEEELQVLRQNTKRAALNATKRECKRICGVITWACIGTFIVFACIAVLLTLTIGQCIGRPLIDLKTVSNGVTIDWSITIMLLLTAIALIVASLTILPAAATCSEYFISKKKVRRECEQNCTAIKKLFDANNFKALNESWQTFYEMYSYDFSNDVYDAIGAYIEVWKQYEFVSSKLNTVLACTEDDGVLYIDVEERDGNVTTSEFGRYSIERSINIEDSVLSYHKARPVLIIKYER